MKNAKDYTEFTTPPTLDDLQEIANSVVDSLPKELGKYIGKLKIEVEDFPDSFIEKELGLESSYDVLGVYQSQSPIGLSKTTKKRQDILFLYRRPILDQWIDLEEDIAWLVNRVILNEIGLHFGFTEDEIDMYEDEILEKDSDLIICE